ncbi:ion transporter [Malaciobacter sp. WC5094]
MKLKQELYIIFENPRKHKYGTIIQIAIFLNIFISIAVLFLQTEKSLSQYFNILSTINFINVVLFSIEYLLRVYSISYKAKIVKYLFRPYMIIDLIAILPFYLSMFNLDFGFLRALRILRIFKLFRLAKFGEFDNLISSIIKEKKEEFLFITVVLFVLLLTITPLVYYFEKDAQPEVFTSMITAMWWAVITFTTVGYGDMYPVTVMGRILTTIVSFLGIAFYAIPGSIFTSALLEKINEKKHNKKREKDD